MLAQAAAECGHNIIPGMGDRSTDPGVQHALDRQPRRGAPPIISEFAQTFSIVLPASTDAKVGSVVWLPDRNTYVKILDAVIGGDGGTACQVGLWRTSLEFVSLALVTEHPFNSTALMHEFTKSAIDRITELGVAAVVKDRESNLIRFRRMAKLFAREEEEIHKNMSPGRASVLEGKNILLFRAMLEEVRAPDAQVAALLQDGIPLVGELSRSGYFPHAPRSAATSTSDLAKMAPRLRKAVIEVMGPSGDSELDHAVANGTDEEVAKGWLRGPFLEDDVCREFGDEWICSRRFAVRQSHKVRLIDDLSISRVNKGVSTAEKIELQGVDCLLAACRYWFRQQGDDREPLLGKCVDLEGAYRQLAIRDEDYKFAVLAVWRPELGAVRFYSMRAVPFGAVASVYCFLRFSLSLQLILAKLFHIPLTSYFDDFAILSTPYLEGSTDATVKEVFELLGWRVSTNPKK
eukprot:3355600-Amphidinium_carterae.1